MAYFLRRFYAADKQISTKDSLRHLMLECRRLSFYLSISCKRDTLIGMIRYLLFEVRNRGKALRHHSYQRLWRGWLILPIKMTILMNCTKRQFCILRWPIIIPILTEMDEPHACSIYGIWCSMGTRLHCLHLFPIILPKARLDITEPMNK